MSRVCDTMEKHVLLPLFFSSTYSPYLDCFELLAFDNGRFVYFVLFCFFFVLLLRRYLLRLNLKACVFVYYGKYPFFAYSLFSSTILIMLIFPVLQKRENDQIVLSCEQWKQCDLLKKGEKR